MKNKKAFWLFILLSFGLSWLLALAMYLFDYEYTGKTSAIIGVVYMYMPLVAAIIVQKFVVKEKLVESLLIRFKLNGWWAFAWLTFIVLGFVALGVALLWPDVSYAPEMEGMIERFKDKMTAEQLEEMRASVETLPFSPLFMAVIQALIAGLTINAVVAFGEELGWRGFLVRNLQDFSFWKATLWIGGIWGLWHAPLILQGHNYPEYPVTGVFMMIVWCVLLTPFFLYAVLKTQSVISAAIMHGTLNASFGISIMTIQGGHPLIVGYTGLAGFIALAAALLLLWGYDQKYGGKVMEKSLAESLP